MTSLPTELVYFRYGDGFRLLVAKFDPNTARYSLVHKLHSNNSSVLIDFYHLLISFIKWYE